MAFSGMYQGFQKRRNFAMESRVKKTAPQLLKSNLSPRKMVHVVTAELDPSSWL